MSRLILVVDGNAGVRNQIAALIERIGYEAQQARNGREALEAASQLQPALVLLEVNLTEVSGYEVCRQLRDGFGNEIAIVFLSGERTEPYDRAAGLLLGCRRLHRQAVRRGRAAGAGSKRTSSPFRASLR